MKERIKDPANEEVITLNEKGEVEKKEWCWIFHTLRNRISSNVRDTGLFRVFDAGSRGRKGK